MLGEDAQCNLPLLFGAYKLRYKTISTITGRIGIVIAKTFQPFQIGIIQGKVERCLCFPSLPPSFVLCDILLEVDMGMIEV